MNVAATFWLELTLLGTFGARLDGAPLSGFRSAKVRALLAYLAAEPRRPHRREALATLFWGEYPEHDAQRSLSQALTNLRRLLAPLSSPVLPASAAEESLLAVAGQTVEWRPRPGLVWVDLHAFDALLDDADPRRASALEERDPCRPLAQAVALYRGPFLAGLALPGCPEFEEWRLLQQEQRHLAVLQALERLVACHLAAGRTGLVERFARQALALEPWSESAHQSLMLALALDGRRAAALWQYQECRRILSEELGAEPSAETEALQRQIRAGASGDLAPPLYPGPAASAVFPAPPFVARERELGRLEEMLELALRGQGRVALVAGEAGSGKTELLAHFARGALPAHRQLVAAGGRCSAYGGLGDPFLPFREILQGLCGETLDFQAGYRRDPDHLRRLSALFPAAAQALVELGPDLIGRFVPAEALLARAETLAAPRAPWRARLAELQAWSALSPPGEGATSPGVLGAPAAPGQEALFGQVARVLRALARRHPLLLLLDDLQWADAASLSLLFHLGRQLDGSRILLVGAYRPGEITFPAPSLLRQEGDGRHPLEAIAHEFVRLWGDICVDLDRAGGRPFVDALLDREPNRLGEAFRQRLSGHTGGQALFTLELLRMFQERGELVRDEAGRWVEGPVPHGEGLPPRVEAVIAERVGRLPRQWQRVLEAAAVEGDPFNAEVVARALGLEAGWVRDLLSGPLGDESRLVQPLGVQRLAEGGEALSRYRFAHALFHEYLAGRLDVVRRARLHGQVGAALESLCSGDEAALAQLSRQLANRYEQAGEARRAVRFLLLAGQQATRLVAYDEAVALYRRGLALLSGLPDSPERDGQELDLQLALGSVLLATEGMGNHNQLAAYGRAYELSRRLGEQVALWPALHALASASTARGQYPQALELGEQLLALAERAADPVVLALAHFSLGATLFSSGTSLPRAREHLEQAIRIYDLQCDGSSRRTLASLNIFDLGVNARVWLANVLWILGYPDQALQRGREALDAAQQLDHFLSRVLALYGAGHAHQARGDDQGLSQVVQALEQLVRGKQLLVGEVWVAVFGGWLLLRAGQGTEGQARLRRGTDAWQKTGAIFGTTYQLGLLVEACLLAGEPGEGLEAVEQALALVERTGARPNEAELHRLRGELLLACRDAPDEAQAEECFGRAIELARAGEQKRWELRAATSLARLWRAQGRRAEARDLLAPVYGWFSEGFDTPDLVAARALLGELGWPV